MEALDELLPEDPALLSSQYKRINLLIVDAICQDVGSPSTFSEFEQAMLR